MDMMDRFDEPKEEPKEAPPEQPAPVPPGGYQVQDYPTLNKDYFAKPKRLFNYWWPRIFWLVFALLFTTPLIMLGIYKQRHKPHVSLSSPSSGASFFSPASIPIIADAWDKKGTISSVTFYASSGERIMTLAKDSSPKGPLRSTYSATWEEVPPGEYQITAMAEGRGGYTISEPVTITVSPRPEASP